MPSKGNGTRPRAARPRALEAAIAEPLAEVKAEAEERAVAELQAAAEGVELTGYAEFRGKRYRIGDTAGLMPLLEFAHAAENGLTSADSAGLNAMYEMIRGCFILKPACGECEACDGERFEQCPQFDPGDWPRFRRLARAVCAGAAELFEFTGQVTEQVTARPTRPRSGSSSPERTGSRNSKAPSPSPELPGDLVTVDSLLRSPR